MPLSTGVGVGGVGVTEPLFLEQASITKVRKQSAPVKYFMIISKGSGDKYP
jgi:hypothetical protein